MFIAEIGINHNGNLDLALQIIDMVHENGLTDVVKFQKRNPDICIPEDMKEVPRKFQGKTMSYLEYKHKLELNKNDYDIINEYCKKIGIKWTASVLDIDSLKFMLEYEKDIPFIKLPSAAITNKELIREANKSKVPIVMSDGMSSWEEVEEAINSIQNLKGLMHCNSAQPSIYAELDLNVINFYQLKYGKKIPYIGYSGHEAGFYPTILAYAKGANIIERHVTLDKNIEGPEQKISLDKNELNRIKYFFDIMDKMSGDYLPHCYSSEALEKRIMRK